MTLDYTQFVSAAETFSLSNKEANATIKIYMPWFEIIAFATQQVGGIISNFGVLQFALPATHPFIPNLWVTEVSAEPAEGVIDTVHADWAVGAVTISYGLLQFPSGSDQKIEIEYEVSGEEMLLARSQFHVNGIALDDSDVQPIKVVNTAKLRATFPFRPTLDPSLWSLFSGKVNSAPFPSWLPGAWSSEKVMFQSPNTKRSWAFASGVDTWSHEYNFAIKCDDQCTWNSIWRPTDGWVHLDENLYDLADLNQIFLGVPLED